MASHTLPIRIEFCVSEHKNNLIKGKIAQLCTRNNGAYLCNMSIGGYIPKVGYTKQKKLAAAVNRVASNINHICRRINPTRYFDDEGISDLKAKQSEIRELLRQCPKNES